jgi:hypothetical protein
MRCPVCGSANTTLAAAPSIGRQCLVCGYKFAEPDESLEERVAVAADTLRRLGFPKVAELLERDPDPEKGLGAIAYLLSEEG